MTKATVIYKLNVKKGHKAAFSKALEWGNRADLGFGMLALLFYIVIQGLHLQSVLINGQEPKQREKA